MLVKMIRIYFGNTQTWKSNDLTLKVYFFTQMVWVGHFVWEVILQ